jgi:hypothetical protein
MTKSLPSNPSDYQEAARYNREQLLELLKVALPELHIVATMMDKTQVNPAILFHVIRHMAEIAEGTGYGQVHVMIEDGTARFVKGEHSTKLNEPVIKPML